MRAMELTFQTLPVQLLADSLFMKTKINLKKSANLSMKAANLMMTSQYWLLQSLFLLKKNLWDTKNLILEVLKVWLWMMRYNKAEWAMYLRSYFNLNLHLLINIKTYLMKTENFKVKLLQFWQNETKCMSFIWMNSKNMKCLKRKLKNTKII